MPKPGTSLSILAVCGALGAWLMGCPVWDESGHGGPTVPPDAGTPDVPPTPQTCSSHRDCTNGYCDSTTNRCVTSPTCMSSASCQSGFYCDMRGICTPGCGADADCARLGTGLVCNTTSHTCQPSGRCTSDAQCSGATPVCLGGSCQPRTSQCQFAYQCTGSGQACVDGRCVVACTAGNASTVCAAGQVCTNGRCAYPSNPGANCGGRCTAGQLCVDGVCLRTCSADTECGAGNMCDHGVCRVDTRPRPLCTMDSECNRGSVCFNGACRLLCPSPGTGSDGGCMTVDVQFNLCREITGRSLCTNTTEQNPECARTAECSAGRACVNARCQ